LKSTTLKRVLIIDDDRIYLFGLSKLIELKTKSGDVTIKHNGQIGWEYLHEQIQTNGDLPNVILLDLNMPILDGWDFLDMYNEISAEVKAKMDVYIMSSSIAQSDLEKAKSYSDVKGYFIKPLTVEQLRALLE
jgi:CheY-like chemotaxis protein